MRIDLDALFSAAQSPYVLLDPELRIVWVNDAYTKAVGRDREALIGRLILEEFPVDVGSKSDQMLRTSFSRVLTTGQPDHLALIPYPIISATGQMEERFWSATHTPIRDAGGAVEFILQNTVDVTDLYRNHGTTPAESIPRQAALIERAEAVATENLALEAMTEFFRSAFDQAPSFMAVVNGPDHVFQIVNQSYFDLVGERELVGLTVREALPDLEGQGFFELLDQVYTTGKSISITGMAATLQAPSHGQPAHRFIDFIYHPLKDETGKSTGIFVQGHDVTGQKLAEEQLAATREKFRMMAQTMPNHVWTAQPDGGLDWLSDQLYEYTGMEEGELYGTDWGRAVHPEDIGAAADMWANSLARGVGYDAEFRIRKADGSYRWHLVRATPLRSAAGELIGWVGTNTDIQERRTAEDQIAELNATLETRVEERNRELEALHSTLRQSQKMEAIGNLAGGIAHDFNNLLQVITGNLQLSMRELDEGSPALERMTQAMKSVKRGATLASQLLSFARKQPLEPVVVNLERLLGDMMDILHSAIGEGVELETRFADGLWNSNIDPSSLENALLNLAINARDAMDRHGKLTIQLENAELKYAETRAYPGVEPGQYVTLAITDTGTGMSPEVIDRIFEPFFTTKEDGHGTGLGLSMVYGFAKQSGGHITIESALGRGTTITLFLPRSLEVDIAVRPTAATGLPRGSEIILLVEDDDDVRDTAFNMLTDLGYQVMQAENGETALQIIEGDDPIDLLFTDVVMPGGMTGQALSEQALLLRPELPVLFTSGYVQDSIVHHGRLDEGVKLLGKPYTQMAMAQKIRSILGTTSEPSLPRTTPDAVISPSAPPLDASPTDPVEAAGLNILLCEDDVLIRTDIAFGLRDAGCEVLEAGTVADALQILQTSEVALLITDLGLPDGSGTDLASQARSSLPSLPIIFATGGVGGAETEMLGNCRVLTKPFLDTDLLNAVSALIGQLPAPKA
jgi:PAS domain S-box-containing protein